MSHRVEGAWEGPREKTHDHSEGSPSSKGEPKRPPVDIESLAQSSTSSTSELKSTVQEVVPSKTSLVPTSMVPTPMSLSVAPLAEEAIPDRTMAPPSKVSTEEDNEIHQEGPGRVAPIEFSPTPQQVIHWERQVEHFPVPTESIIQLPTGKPISIPKIQYQFSDETVMARTKREERLEKVKEEFKRAWNGYKTYAWMHDELSPVSGEYRDPFAGWAATLVDSLDTLYIMGLDEDFEEAVRAVGNIDFTTAKRQDIQVFETTIRYLGGLLAAYDVSGGTKKILLDKAVELGEVLMGAFDTPNRMPVLYYNWKPTFASQPHRASARSNLAELGSLAMEFTHLAQLTKKAKYYDAVARITDALFEWQSRGTTGLPGVFPQDVDASGCNRSVPVVNHSLPSLPSSTPNPVGPLSGDGEGYKPPTPKNVKEPRPLKGKGAKELADIELSVIPGEPSKAQIERILPRPEAGAKKLSKRTESSIVHSNATLPPKDVTDLDHVLPVSPTPRVAELARDLSEIPSRGLGDWDCVPMGLESSNFGRDSFSLGGSQDSTYEYFSKVSTKLSFHSRQY
jgi:mannosyl-oligosaccharide alpha-1,2-mannosidase